MHIMWFELKSLCISTEHWKNNIYFHSYIYVVFYNKRTKTAKIFQNSFVSYVSYISNYTLKMKNLFTSFTDE